MNKIILIGIVISALMFSSCVKDLDVKPADPNSILGGNLNDDPVYLKEVLVKIYASFLLPGQGGSQTSNGVDITAADPNFTTTTRALWNCQELTTDEAICAWGDAGIADFNTQTWTANNPFLTALYSRLVLSITYANDFIKLTGGNTNPDVIKYNSEARFLRALAYYYAIDLFGNPPFTTEAEGVGKFYPKQIKRIDLFNFITSELKSIENLLGTPGFSYPRADQGACWMLLSRMYLNAEVFTGTAKYDSCKMYCDKVISSGKYSLATKYRQNFSADNDYLQNKEMIFSWASDGVNTQGYVGTTFIIESSSDGTHIDAHTLGLTSNTNWGGNRTKRQFLNVLVDTIATYGNVAVPWATDTIFASCPDKRVFCKRLDYWNIPTPSSSYAFGIGVYKFTNFKSDGSQASNYNSAYASTDYPVFRYADALLMRAEALHRLNDNTNAVIDINAVRSRAYGNATGNITADKVTDQFLLNERGREFYFEGQRRTDLIRFGQFSNGTYTWTWKGGNYNGIATDSHLNIFPIPGDEVSANRNIKQNPGY